MVRHSALRRTAFKRAPKKVPKARRGREWPQEVKDAVWRRSGGMCEAKASPECRKYAGQLHHRRMRSQGGPDTVENALHVCTPCHGYIHDNPQQSYEAGWLIRRQ